MKRIIFARIIHGEGGAARWTEAKKEIKNEMGKKSEPRMVRMKGLSG